MNNIQKCKAFWFSKRTENNKICIKNINLENPVRIMKNEIMKKLLFRLYFFLVTLMMSWKRQLPRGTKCTKRIKITLSERIGKIYE
jgi:hypothetical protein